MKKVWKFLTSMKFAIILLVILSLAMAGGSFITQNQSYEWYASEYSERTAAFIIALRLDDVFHSWWFLALFILLCLDIFFCNVTKLPVLIRRVKKAEKAKAGVFGPFVAHIGMLLLIIGFVLGQVTKEEYTVYGYPGQVVDLGDTGIRVGIDDFQVSFNEDDSVSQYTADLVVTKESLIVLSQASVNHPAKVIGYRFYQNSFGYTAHVRVLDSGTVIQEDRIMAGGGLTIQDRQAITVVFNAFYPDYEYSESIGPSTKSGRMRNPGYLYSVYYGETMLGMNVLTKGETIRIDDYEVIFDDPGYYTVLQVKKDSFTWLALAGGLVLMAGFFLSFYVKPLSQKNSEPQEEKKEEPSAEEPESIEEALEPDKKEETGENVTDH